MAKQVVLQKNPEITASILDNSRLEAYNESVKSYNNSQLREFLNRYGSSGTDLIGSSPLMHVHLRNSGLLPKDAVLIQRGGELGLETVIDKAQVFLIGNYVDFGLALRTAGDNEYSQNDLLAKTLADDLKKKGFNLGKSGLLVPLEVLSIKENNESNYGAVFRLDGDRATKDNIRPLDESNWNYYKIEEGLARAGLGRHGEWFSFNRDLASSSGDGRVVVLTSVDGSKKILDSHSRGINDEIDNKVAELEELKRSASQRIASLRTE